MERGLCPSREKAQRLVLAGQVRLNGRPASKPSDAVKEEDALELVGQERFVSRGGEKLQAALDHFKISAEGKIALDIGASTGGFTDCLLQAGAKKVYAVDVGDNQLAWKIRSDPRVVARDGVNARNLDPADFPDAPELVTADVSFISLEKVLPAARRVAPCASMVVLIKPQFEAGRDQVGKGGVVRSPEVHEAVVEKIRRFAVESLGMDWAGVLESPLRGPAGNKEFLAFLRPLQVF